MKYDSGYNKKNYLSFFAFNILFEDLNSTLCKRLEAIDFIQYGMYQLDTFIE